MQQNDNYLMHHGIKGQKWGVRNYQNVDGTLTAEGKERYQKKVAAMFGDVKGILRRTGARTANGIKSAASKAMTSFADKHKPVSQMSDSELRDRLNRLNMERQYKQVKDDLSGKNRPRKTFGDKHPLLKQMFITTAVSTVSNLVSDQMRVKSDELLGKKRMDRAKEKGMTNNDLLPFVSKQTAGRISAYQKTEDAAKTMQKTIDEAIAKARKTYKLPPKKGGGVKTAKWGVRSKVAKTLLSGLGPLKVKNVDNYYAPSLNKDTAKTNLELIDQALKRLSKT